MPLVLIKCLRFCSFLLLKNENYFWKNRGRVVLKIVMKTASKNIFLNTPFFHRKTDINNGGKRVKYEHKKIVYNV
jgi:hypothetical protein